MFIKCLVVLIALLSLIECGGQPKYQVSLYIHLRPKARPIHLCNGIIVQSRVILTTASCVQYQFTDESPTISIHPSMISVIAGSADEFNEVLIFKVSSIDVATQFNATTMENDLALLRLSSYMPLGLRQDMKWIIMDDSIIDDTITNGNDIPCLASFYVKNLTANKPDYVQTEELEIIETSQCANMTSYPAARKSDICSYYELPMGFDCNALDDFVQYNGFHGTGLVCNSRLVGLLSTIFPVQKNVETNDCTDVPVTAFYVNIGPHLDWIYQIIAEEEYIAIVQDHQMTSTPYTQETMAIIQSTVQPLATRFKFDDDAIDSTTEMPTTTETPTTTTPPARANQSKSNNGSKWHLTLLSLIMHVISLI